MGSPWLRLGLSVIADVAELIARVRQRDPNAAIALADLVEARSLQSTDGVRRRRGGDPKAAGRTERNEAVRALGALLSAELSLERQVREIICKVRRYRPAVGDENGDGERGVLHQLVDSGLPLPGTRQLKRILATKSLGPRRPGAGARPASRLRCALDGLRQFWEERRR